MKNTNDLLRYRLSVQQLARHDFKQPEEVVSWLGAVQAQDYMGALWAIGMRTPASTEATIEQALADKKIVRTWPMRGTLHFVAAADVRWMLGLCTPKIIASQKARHKELELNEKVFTQSSKIFVKALSGNNCITRDGMYQLLEEHKISPSGQRGIHILLHLSQKGLLCFGPRTGKQQTFVLLDEWVPATKTPEREEALAKMTIRYFNSHGPATVQDFAWWAGFTLTDARLGITLAEKQLEQEILNGETYWYGTDTSAVRTIPKKVFLLPNYDEYIVAYKDRTALADMSGKKFKTILDNPIFKHTIIDNGQVIGNWRRTLQKEKVSMEIVSFGKLSVTQQAAIAATVKQYGRFLGKEPVYK